MEIHIDLTPEAYRALPEAHKTIFRRGLAAALNQGLFAGAAQTWSDIATVLQICDDYELTLGHKQSGQAVPTLTILPLSENEKLDWTDAVELGLEVDDWGLIEWYEGDLHVACLVTEFRNHYVIKA